jgi:ATP-binding protein involved in chromosome partitioning
MASLKDEVLAKLAAVAAPDGRPLPATGKLSEIVAEDGKVFFSCAAFRVCDRSWSR